MMSGRVIVLGSLNVDLVTRVRRHPGPGETVLGEGHQRIAGGKGGNQAVAAAASGADVRFVGAVGEDEAGAAYLARLAGRGVDVHAVRIVPGATGHALVVVDEEGENTIVVIPGANAAVGPEVEAALSDLGHGDVFLMQLELPPYTVATAALAAARSSPPTHKSPPQPSSSSISFPKGKNAPPANKSRSTRVQRSKVILQTN